MEVPEWVASVGKVFGGALAGVWVGQRHLEARVTALEEADRSKATSIKDHEEMLTDIHKTVQADHDLLTGLNTKMEMVMTALAVRVKP